MRKIGVANNLKNKICVDCIWFDSCFEYDECRDVYDCECFDNGKENIESIIKKSKREFDREFWRYLEKEEV